MPIYSAHLTNPGNPGYPGVRFRVGIRILFTKEYKNLLVVRVTFPLHPGGRDECGVYRDGVLEVTERAIVHFRAAVSLYLSCHLFPLSICVCWGVAPASVIHPPDTQVSYIQTLVLCPASLLNCKNPPSVSKGAAEYRSPSKNSKCSVLTVLLQPRMTLLL